MKAGLAVLHFGDARAFVDWLAAHGATSAGAWLMFARKGAAVRSVGRGESIDAALCEGWIDGQAAVRDDSFFLVRFTPRRARSTWSQVNRARATALIETGRMRPRGLAEIEAARADGRWDAAYPPSSTAEAPPDLQAALDAAPSAAARYSALGRSGRHALILGLANARLASTRARRIGEFCDARGDGRSG